MTQFLEKMRKVGAAISKTAACTKVKQKSGQMSFAGALCAAAHVFVRPCAYDAA
ncbi:MAG: hypothetical protein IPH37_18735 [Burkholderiales bacterium]|nr:hypothetical protein [Burkholderiales bacterium]